MPCHANEQNSPAPGEKKMSIFDFILYLEKTLEKTDSALGSLSAGKTGLFSFDSVDKLSPIQTSGYDKRFNICPEGWISWIVI